MHLEEFKLYHNICIDIKNSKTFKKTNFDQLKQSFNFLFQTADLLILLGFPSRELKKKVLFLIERDLGRKIPLNFLSNINKFLSSNEQTKFFEFSLFYLISTDFKLYSTLKKEIHRYFGLFKPFLIELLVHENDALAINAGRILNEIEPHVYESDKILEILPKLPRFQKEKLFQILKSRLKILDLAWHLKEDAIIKLGSLDSISSLEVLESYIEDPDIEIRKILSISLGFIHSEKSVHLLYQLLLDEFKEIHYLATESLAKIMPGLYSNSIPQEILLSLEPLTLLKIMPNRPFDSFIRRLWDKNHFNSIIIEKYYQISDIEIIKGYQKLTLQGSDQTQIDSIKLIVLSRIPQILVEIENLIHSESNEDQKATLRKIFTDIQYLTKIERENDLPILL
ncbi:HEAT repeat domain-containing protein [Candidatus Lokiarchaeum ossiferum]|uniref:HEAT repeat domain-containing protein n=1 Tax=Candidatus Lokiarchaeum ossiferum TaxID=2951803 RepID=UPI00352DF876